MSDLAFCGENWRPTEIMWWSEQIWLRQSILWVGPAGTSNGPLMYRSLSATELNWAEFTSRSKSDKFGRTHQWTQRKCGGQIKKL